MARNKSTTISAAARPSSSTLPSNRTRPKVTVKLPSVKSKSAADGQRTESARIGPFRGVSEIDVAPISIGNTLRSSKPMTSLVRDGVSVTGRDFLQAIGGIGVGGNWCLSGGIPLTPAALVASALRGYFSSYQEYRFRRVIVHFITSSPTSTSGDVLVLHHDNRAGPKVNHNSNNFLSYAMSTTSAILGPQWANHSMVVDVGDRWLSTDIFNAEDVQHQSDGEILVYSRNTINGQNPDSPGFIVMDYAVEFRHMMVNPRILTLPSSLLKLQNTGLQALNVTPALGDRVVLNAFGQSYVGSNPTSFPGDVGGAVYQIVFDVDTAFSNPNGLPLATMWSVKGSDNPDLIPWPVTTGTTAYIASFTLPVCVIYPNYDAVMAGRPLVWTAAHAGGVTISFAVTLSLVGSITTTFLQANIG